MLRAISLPSPARSDRTFAIAAAIVVLLGASEFFAVAFYYAGRARAEQISTEPSVTAVTSTASTQTAAATPATVPAAAAIPPSAAAPAPSATAPPVSVVPVSRPEQLLREARSFRERGDTTNALAKLQEAAGLDDRNGEVLAEMAMIYESMQLFERSNETWRRLQGIGPAAGALYELADLKLKIGVPSTAAVGRGITGPGAADATAAAEAEGIPDGSDFGITEASPTMQNDDPNADTKLSLRVAVKARPNTAIDHTKVKIQVFFYDVVDNDQVVLTDADVNYQWLTEHHNWSDTNPEVLEVSYARPKREAVSPDIALSEQAAAVTPPPLNGTKKPKKGKRPESPAAGPSGAELLPSSESGQRKYLGYIVRVYYKDQLQAVRADPTKLLNLFPPPFTAPPQ